MVVPMPEEWWCPECGECRAVDGKEGYACDAPRDCPNSEEWPGENCGYIVCGTCHAPMSDRHLAPGASADMVVTSRE
jgi:hypothetical protein